MRIETIEKQIYNYDDLFLSENIDLKNKVLEKLHDINTEHINNMQDYNDIYSIELSERGFNNITMFYDCSCSQGSGACFDCTEFNFDILLSDFNCVHKKWIIQVLDYYYSGKILERGNSNLYSHSNTRYFKFDSNMKYDYNRLESIINNIEKHIENKRQEACGWLYYTLCKEFDYLQSEEAILKTIQCNEYEFDIDGNIT